MSFQGVFQHSIDAKGRTSLPARFREHLSAQNADKLFITTDLLDDCLIAYAPAAWDALLAKVAALNTFAESTRQLTRGFIAPAQECPVDKLGRILIPPTLREFARLSEEISWAGQGERIEIWSPQAWAEVQRKARAPENKAAMMKSLSELHL